MPAQPLCSCCTGTGGDQSTEAQGEIDAPKEGGKGPVEAVKGAAASVSDATQVRMTAPFDSPLLKYNVLKYLCLSLLTPG